MNKIDFDELWIGDRLWLTTKSIHVKWEGRVGKEKAKVRLFDQIHLVPLSDLEAEREAASSYVPHEAPTKVEVEQALPLSFESKTIDLHIEVLKPKLQHERAEIILDYQLRACRQFLTMAIAQKRPNVTIIHGKGEGVLRLEVEHLLKEFAEINFAVPVNNGGASEVWFSYR